MMEETEDSYIHSMINYSMLTLFPFAKGVPLYIMEKMAEGQARVPQPVDIDEQLVVWLWGCELPPLYWTVGYDIYR